MTRKLNKHVLRLGLAFFVLTGIYFSVTDPRYIVYNTSNSLPRGLYVSSDEEAIVGSLIEFAPPQEAKNYAEQRWGSPPQRVLFLKPVIAIAGDHVDATGIVLLINGVTLGPISSHDSEGYPLPRWRESRVLHEGEVFVFSDFDPKSFDSRYYGPIHCEDIQAVRRPLLVW